MYSTIKWHTCYVPHKPKHSLDANIPLTQCVLHLCTSSHMLMHVCLVVIKEGAVKRYLLGHVASAANILPMPTITIAQAP